MGKEESAGLTKALNEWAVVVKALGEGYQICLIRKKRISSYQEFALYPTYAGQKKAAIQPEYHSLFKEARQWEKDGNTEIYHWARLEGVIEVEDVRSLVKLQDYYVWEPSHVESYCSDQGSCFLILVRVFKLTRPRAFGRSRSPSIVWRNLEHPLPVRGSEPVLSDEEFEKRVALIQEALKPVPTPPRPGSIHEQIKNMIYEIGQMEGKVSEKEYPLDGDRLDVAWKRVSAGNPSEVFEVHIGGDFFKTLAKLKHAWDMWNSRPFLVTTEEYVKLARDWIEGSFHEVKKVIKIVDWTEIKRLYRAEKALRELKRELDL